MKTKKATLTSYFSALSYRCMIMYAGQCVVWCAVCLLDFTVANYTA